ncbi:hypothetical protein Ocin01_19120 [Orchesella cincta]|uniref:F-box domain-containing protein n=1 Tax=Orchesella cincta TaxID=48709 RepID=A0A1D2M3Q1_ORCCI|nr:hypothetical protein Ocin01_19120 [Orchesella cincta]
MEAEKSPAELDRGANSDDEEDLNPSSSPKRARHNHNNCANDLATDSGQEDDDLQSTIHPLLIDHVAKKIFSFLKWERSNPTILNCRQVCKTWYHIISNLMKRKRMVGKRIFGYGDTDRMENFLNVMRNTTNLPINEFEFDVNFFISRNELIFNEFLSVCSPFITHLSLSFGKHYSMNLMSMDFENVNFCNLKSLTFQCVYMNTMQHVNKESAKQLESFEFCIPSQHFDGEYAKQANARFGNLLASEALAGTVKNLKLIMEIQQNHLAGLSRLKLQKLRMNFYGSQLNAGAIEQFLQQQAGTLVELRISDLENKFAEHLSFPQLNKVKFLEIKGGNSSSFAFLKFFPKMETFVLRNGRNSNPLGDSNDSKEVEAIMYPTVKEVELTYPIESINLVQRIASYFPNLQVFKIQAGPDSTKAIESIFETMTDLVELQIVFPQMFSNQPLDPLFTGIPVGWCHRIKENEAYNIQDQNDVYNAVVRKPSLDNLKKLQRLSIQAESYAIILTDVSVHYSFFRLPALSEIILGSGCHSISSECFQMLKTRFKVTERSSIIHTYI